MIKTTTNSPRSPPFPNEPSSIFFKIKQNPTENCTLQNLHTKHAFLENRVNMFGQNKRNVQTIEGREKEINPLMSNRKDEESLGKEEKIKNQIEFIKTNFRIRKYKRTLLPSQKEYYTPLKHNMMKNSKPGRATMMNLDSNQHSHSSFTSSDAEIFENPFIKRKNALIESRNSLQFTNKTSDIDSHTLSLFNSNQIDDSTQEQSKRNIIATPSRNKIVETKTDLNTQTVEYIDCDFVDPLFEKNNQVRINEGREKKKKQICGHQRHTTTQIMERVNNIIQHNSPPSLKKMKFFSKPQIHNQENPEQKKIKQMQRKYKQGENEAFQIKELPQTETVNQTKEKDDLSHTLNSPCKSDAKNWVRRTPTFKIQNVEKSQPSDIEIHEEKKDKSVIHKNLDFNQSFSNDCEENYLKSSFSFPNNSQQQIQIPEFLFQKQNQNNIQHTKNELPQANFQFEQGFDSPTAFKFHTISDLEHNNSDRTQSSACLPEETEPASIKVNDFADFVKNHSSNINIRSRASSNLKSSCISEPVFKKANTPESFCPQMLGINELGNNVTTSLNYPQENMNIPQFVQIAKNKRNLSGIQENIQMKNMNEIENQPELEKIKLSTRMPSLSKISTLSNLSTLEQLNSFNPPFSLPNGGRNASLGNLNARNHPIQTINKVHHRNKLKKQIQNPSNLRLRPISKINLKNDANYDLEEKPKGNLTSQRYINKGLQKIPKDEKKMGYGKHFAHGTFSPHERKSKRLPQHNRINSLVNQTDNFTDFVSNNDLEAQNSDFTKFFTKERIPNSNLLGSFNSCKTSNTPNLSTKNQRNGLTSMHSLNYSEPLYSFQRQEGTNAPIQPPIPYIPQNAERERPNPTIYPLNTKAAPIPKSKKLTMFPDGAKNQKNRTNSKRKEETTINYNKKCGIFRKRKSIVSTGLPKILNKENIEGSNNCIVHKTSIINPLIQNIKVTSPGQLCSPHANNTSVYATNALLRNLNLGNMEMQNVNVPFNNKLNNETQNMHTHPFQYTNSHYI